MYIVPRIARCMQLEDFVFVIEHRSAARMRHVDALSRVVMQIGNRFIIVENMNEEFMFPELTFWQKKRAE